MENLEQALIITLLVLVMIMLVDYIEVLTRGRLSILMKGGHFRQYIISSAIATTPGCLGAFMNVSFYIHGLLSFGALTGSMIAASGDEAFVMLAMFPGQALTLFGILFILGIVFGWIIDKLAPLLRVKPCLACKLSELHLDDKGCKPLNWKDVWEHLRQISLVRFLLLSIFLIFFLMLIGGVVAAEASTIERGAIIAVILLALFIILTVSEHYLEEHIWNHIIKKHLWRVFLWSFLALVVVDIGLKHWNLESFAQTHMVWIIFIAALVGIIPESGPHLIFVVMFSQGIIPFSVLLTSAIIQDGHGMLPLLSYAPKDAALIKMINIVIGLSCGLILYLMGF
ncbi:selenocysteine protein [Candidatus Desantisbacteria bacterium CG2_30_40_21]|uniref:Selenocysteine protein n=5 Tax=unclassified Candidatus Desantisiibacteriota TaxID=3106372 RepID=A0A2M7JDR7_9BACT|nr:MAG: selenocysteine protein [Candidatus Desantisbacteria bacterium CG2_30_40_21]PIP39984.1 MAG: selenocysteine protein [Candidatus Desantisbacteria bacterium CG23_combo_of_CG06-09_8_20_14_all_40_23]PIX17560.1 MAG: selenocysteine protein [Candidatus Desantisbacteria bacterium CG_4_8_14_3_um_filter_40_12]